MSGGRTSPRLMAKPCNRVRLMKVGFIGAGNMATGIARGLARARAGEPGAPEAMLFADAAAERAREAGRARSAARRSTRTARSPTPRTWCVLAVKPNVLDDVAADLVEAGTPVISILAGHLAGAAGRGAARARAGPRDAEPGRAAAPGGALRRLPDGPGRTSAASGPPRCSALLGDVIEIDEDLIDAATALMGCSPGYLALMAEVLVEAGVEEGLTEDQSLRMVARSMAATGGLLEHAPARRT